MYGLHEKRWTCREAAPGVTERLMRDLSLPSLLARLLAHRGMDTSEDASRFISSSLAEMHDPFLMRGMTEAAERLSQAILDHERICIYGDYDVDGVTSTALLVGFLRQIGGDCFYYIPQRLEEGYGLNREGIEKVATRKGKLIVSVDCGITAIEEAEFCTSLGIDLIISDHHTPGESLPHACAVLNPHQKNCPFPCKNLAGVGIAFNLAVATRGRLRQKGFFEKCKEPNLRECLDLVALGTVADIVPLLDMNRVFVKQGLKELTKSSRLGVQALKRVSGVNGEVDCGTVGFRFAPRLNAAGRLEDASLGVELLLCTDSSKADVIAAQLDESNTVRQSIEQAMLRDVLEQMKNTHVRKRKSIVLASENWHPGVVGIVASRIVDLYHRPTILIAMKDGNGKGSGRSIPAFHLHDGLKACSEHLLKFGGHKYAAGLSIDEETLEVFVERFEEVASGALSPEDLQPQLLIDAMLQPEEVCLETAELVASLEPFGMGNPAPVFAVSGARIVERRVLKEKHLKLKLDLCGSLFEAIGFNMADVAKSEDCVDVAFCLDINNWNGKKSVQLRLKDIRSAAMI